MVGQTIALRGLSSLARPRLRDRRHKAIVCPTCDLLAFGYLITGGQLEEVSGGLGTADIGQTEVLVACPRIAVPGLDIHLQVGGVPALGGDLNRTVIADGAGLDGGYLAHSFGIDAFDRLLAER